MTICGSDLVADVQTGPGDRKPALPAIALAGAMDRDTILTTLALAFHNDPVFSWLFPNEAERLARMKRLFAVNWSIDFPGAMIAIAPGGSAASFWRGPGTAVPSLAVTLRNLFPYLGALGFGLPRALRVNAAIEAHQPSTPFWYVHFVGVRPDQQGHGWGGSMMRYGLAHTGDTPVYLETARIENVTFYETLGFRVTQEWDVPGNGPHFWSMLFTPAAR